MPETLKKVVIKLKDKPLTGNDLDDYARSRKMKFGGFSDNTGLIGEVYNDEEKLVGLLGMETEPWSDYSSFHHNYDLMNRLRIKLFSKGGNKIGVIEERLIKELSMPTSSHKIPIFTAIIKNLPYAVDLDKDSDKFVFAVVTDTRKKILEIFQMNKKTFRLSFEVKRKYLIEKIASIDSKWGGKIEIKIYEEELARKDSFLFLLILFAGTIKYHDEIEHKIRTYSDNLREGIIIIKPTSRAIELMAKSQVEVYAEADKAKAAIEKAKAKARAPKKVKPIPEGLPPGAKVEAEFRRGKRKIRGEKAVPKKPLELVVKPTKGRIKPLQEEISNVLAESASEVKAPEKFKPGVPLGDEATELKTPRLGKPKKMPRTVTKKPPEPDLPPLQLEDSLDKITGMPKEVSKILEEVGIELVDDLIFIDPDALADFIGIKSVTKDKLKKLQSTAHNQIKSTIKKDKELKTKYLEKYKKHADKDGTYM